MKVKVSRRSESNDETYDDIASDIEEKPVTVTFIGKNFCDQSE